MFGTGAPLTNSDCWKYSPPEMMFRQVCDASFEQIDLSSFGLEFNRFVK